MADQAILTIRLQGQGGSAATTQQRQTTVVVPGQAPAAPLPPAGEAKRIGPSMQSEITQVLTALRGSLGGIFGRMAGAALDIMSAAAQPAAQQAAAASPAVPAAPASAAAQPATALSAQGSQIAAGFGKSAQGAFAGGRIGGAAAAGRAGQIPAAMAAPEIAGSVASGGAFAGAAAAAPIVGAGVAVGLEANREFHKLAMSVGEPIEALAKFGATLMDARTDTAIAVKGVSDFSKKLAEVPTILTPLFSAVSGATSALADFMGVVDANANRYGPFSGEITQAQAMADVQQLLGDFRRAQQIGPQMARYIQARSELQQRVEDIKIKLLQKVLPLLEQALRALTSILDGLSAVAGPAREAIDRLGPLANLHPILLLLRSILGVLEQADDSPAFTNDMITQQANFMNVFGSQPRAGGGQP